MKNSMKAHLLLLTLYAYPCSPAAPARDDAAAGAGGPGSFAIAVTRAAYAPAAAVRAMSTVSCSSTLGKVSSTNDELINNFITAYDRFIAAGSTVMSAELRAAFIAYEAFFNKWDMEDPSFKLRSHILEVVGHNRLQLNTLMSNLSTPYDIKHQWVSVKGDDVSRTFGKIDVSPRE